MLFDAKKDLEILAKLKLTTRQLMFIKILIPDRSLNDVEQRRSVYAMALKYQDLCPLSHDEMADLMSREVVINHNKIGADQYYDNYEINPKYMKYFSLKVIGYPSALIDEYPKWVSFSDGRKFNGIDASAVDIAKEYISAINDDEEEHNKVVEDVKWAIKNDEINCGILKFVKTKRWLAIRELRENLSSKTFTDVKIG